MLMALANHNQKMLLLPTYQQLFFTTATIFSSVLYVDYDFHNNLFMEIFVGRFSISSNYFDGTFHCFKELHHLKKFVQLVTFFRVQLVHVIIDSPMF